ncbi:MAG: hypothetical protein RLZZ455_571 [Candidatus Parcubacteria bacterium]|jgi:hypothetical protein
MEGDRQTLVFSKHMENLLKNKTALFYLLAGVVLACIIVFIAIILIFRSHSPTKKQSPTAPSPTISLPTPMLQSEIAPTNEGIFKVEFAKAPNPNNLTITLNSYSLIPGSPTVSVPFSSDFLNDGTQLVVTTDNPIQEKIIYTLYVRLITNNHIVVKHRYELRNGVLTIIDDE